MNTVSHEQPAIDTAVPQCSEQRYAHVPYTHLVRSACEALVLVGGADGGLQLWDLHTRWVACTVCDVRLAVVLGSASKEAACVWLACLQLPVLQPTGATFRSCHST
jgi:hypothetical protein